MSERLLQQTVDYGDSLLALSDSYANLLSGIHQDVWALSEDDQARLRQWEDDPFGVFVGAVERNPATIDPAQSYLKEYDDASFAAWRSTLEFAGQTSDYTPFLDMIKLYREAGLARRFISLREMDGILTNAVAVIGASRRSLEMQRNEAQQTEDQLRRYAGKLAARHSGRLVSLSPLPRTGTKRQVERFIMQPLREIAAQPTVVERAIRNELDALPLTD